MIDSAAEHDQAEALTAHDGLVRVDPANDAPRKVARNLHDCITTSGRIGKGYQIALVMLVGVVAKRRAKSTRRMGDGDHFAAGWDAINVDVER
jgi:hypothetical protein